jgi:hypothetical protein
MATNAEEACTVCGEPAHMRCGACKSDTSSRHYCGKACQAKDWPTHKKACKDAQNANLEKKLARVAEIVQQAYYEFRENTWDTPVIKIDDRYDALVIYDGDMLKKSKYFLKFPHHLVANDRTKKAMLCAWVCNEPMAWMHDTLLALLEGKTCLINIRCHRADPIPTGLNIKIQEVRISLGRIPRKITVRKFDGAGDDNWPNYYHDVIRITSSKTKKQWVIDISGAQYGICRAFWSWEEYAIEHLATAQQAQAIGTNKALLKALAKVPGNPYLTYGLVGLVADQLDQARHKWRADTGLSLAGLLDLDNKKYKKARSELLQTVDVAVRTHVQTNNYKKEFQAAQSYERKYPGKSARICVEKTNSFFAQAATTSTD